MDRYNPNPRHMLWRVWGGMGADTEADLVFDSTGDLAKAAIGLHRVYGCDVQDVRQLEHDWFIVSFYANEGWPGC